MSIINLCEKNPIHNGSHGEKSRNLYILYQKGFNVPRGYVFPNEEYVNFMSPLKIKLNQLIKAEKPSDSCDSIKNLFLETSLNGLRDPFYRTLEDFSDNTYFAVRSSGFSSINGKLILEDSAETALAGQYESFLRVPKSSVEDAVKLCWASLFNERSLRSFKAKSNETYLSSGMSVIIQEMIVGEYSAVMMTRDPLDERDLLGIESTYGPCESLVSGKVTGDFILCDKQSGQVIERDLGSKLYRIEYSEFSFDNQENHSLKENSDGLKNSYALNDGQIKRLFSTGMKIEKIFGKPQDIEAVFFKDKLYIVQTRNITTNNGGN